MTHIKIAIQEWQDPEKTVYTVLTAVSVLKTEPGFHSEIHTLLQLLQMDKLMSEQMIFWITK